MNLKARTEFTKDQFLNFIERKMKDEDQKNFNANIICYDKRIH